MSRCWAFRCGTSERGCRTFFVHVNVLVIVHVRLCKYSKFNGKQKFTTETQRHREHRGFNLLKVCIFSSVSFVPLWCKRDFLHFIAGLKES